MGPRRCEAEAIAPLLSPGGGKNGTDITRPLYIRIASHDLGDVPYCPRKPVVDPDRDSCSPRLIAEMDVLATFELPRRSDFAFKPGRRNPIEYLCLHQTEAQADRSYLNYFSSVGEGARCSGAAPIIIQRSWLDGLVSGRDIAAYDRLVVAQQKVEPVGRKRLVGVDPEQVRSAPFPSF